MDYSFINDPVLRNKLEKASKKNFEKLENNSNNINTNEENILLLNHLRLLCHALRSKFFYLNPFIMFKHL